MLQADKIKAILAAKVRSQAVAFQTKGLGVQNVESGAETKSESRTLAEGGSEVSGQWVGKQKTRDGEESEGLNLRVKVFEIASEVLQKKKKKKRKVSHSYHDAAFDVEVPIHGVVHGTGEGGSQAVVAPENFEIRGSIDDDLSGKDSAEKVIDPETVAGGSLAGGPQAPTKRRIGRKSLSELATMANQIPDGSNLEKLKSHDMEDNIRKDNIRARLTLWAQEGIMIFGDRYMMAKLEKEKKKMVLEIEQRDKLLAEAREELREKEGLIAQKAKEIDEVEDNRDACYAREHTLKENLGHAEYREKAALARAEKAEREVVL